MSRSAAAVSHHDEVRSLTPARLDPGEREVLQLEPVFDAVLRALAADAGLLDAAERGDLGRDEARVDADDAVVERFGDAPDTSDVAAVEVGGEPVRCVVGGADGVLFAREARDAG